MKKSNKVPPSRGLAGRCAPKKDLAWMWWKAGVMAAKVHLPDTVEDDWDNIPASDKAFMQAAAENLISALKSASPRSASPASRKGKSK